MSLYNATFYDGKTAQRYRVKISIDRDHLRIEDQEKSLLVDWPIATLKLIDRVGPGWGTVRLSHGSTPNVRLVVEDAVAVDNLRVHAPQLFRASAKRRTGWALAGLLAVGTLALFYFGVPKGAAWLAPKIPMSWQVSLGERVLDDVVDSYARGDNAEPFCTNVAGVGVLNELVAQLNEGTALIDNDDYDGETYRIIVLRSDLVNAFALPGGIIVLFEKLITDAQSLEEIAGILAHEMGHVSAAHAVAGVVERLSTTMIFDALLGAGTLSDVTSTLTDFSYSRDAEREADAEGLRRMRGAGISSRGVTEFFTRIGAKGGAVPAILSTHPNSKERVAAALADLPLTWTALLPEKLTALKQICETE